MTEVHYGICNFCDSTCGLEIQLDGKNILSIRGDRQDPFSRGHLCPKGPAHKDLYEDPDRLRHPVKREGKSWKEISWDEALDEVGRQSAKIQKTSGMDSLALYFGNPAAHNYRTLLTLLPFIGSLRTRSVYSANSVDAHPRMLVSLLLYGNQALLPIPDIERTHYLLILGGNPVISHGSVMGAPDTKKRLNEIQGRGGKIVVIDPRRTETAEIADTHYFIRPGTDAMFLLAMLHTLHKEGLFKPGRLAALIYGLEDLIEIVERFSPDRVSEAVGIKASEIQSLARDFASAPSAVCYGRMGTCTQEFGCLSTWLIDVVNIVTGNLDCPGGAMFTTPAADLAGLAKVLRQTGQFNRWQSRIGRLPEFNGEFPVAALADEMETRGPGQIKGLITLAGNPVLSCPNGRRLDRALKKLEFMVSIDLYVNETTRHADIILPPTTSLECDHYPILEHSMGIRNIAHYTAAALPKLNTSKHDWEILLEFIKQVHSYRGRIPSFLGKVLCSAGHLIGPERILDLLLRTGPHRLTLKELKKHPHGIDLGPLEPRIEKVLNTKNRRINLLPKELQPDIGGLETKLVKGEGPHKDSLLLVSMRTMKSMNSWLHNCPSLVRGSNRCVLLMHPSDARSRGLRTGQTVRVRSRVGRIEVPLRVSDEVMPGVVCMPFGWGHNRIGSRLSVAKAHAGASMNDIVDDSLFDRVSGTSVLDGIPVNVTSKKK